MDLLCTENIMHENEPEKLCYHQQQSQQKPVSNSSLLNEGSISANASAYVCSNSLTSSTSSCSSANSLGCNSSSSSGISSSSAHSSGTVMSSLTYFDQNATTTTYCANSTNPSSALACTGAALEIQPSNVYNQNLISRSIDYVNTVAEDSTFLTDRCLQNALKAEEKSPQPKCTYFKTVQNDITPPMRKIVAEWMMEVCAEEKCQEEVVLLALNYMDRFLSIKSVRKTHLQILAAACLLLASKLREPNCRALSADLLVFYTDNSIHKNNLIKWELYVLSLLGWNLTCVTPLDFLELLSIRLPIKSSKCPDLDLNKVRQHAQAFILLAAKEHYFSMYSACTIAASSIAAALSGLNWHLRTGRNVRYLLNLLTDLTSVEQDYLQDCMTKMENIFEEHSKNLQPFVDSVANASAVQQHQELHGLTTVCTSSNQSSAASSNASSPILQQEEVPMLQQQQQQQPHNQQQQQEYYNKQNTQSHHHSQHHHHHHHHHYLTSNNLTLNQHNLYQHHNHRVCDNANSSVLLPDVTQNCKIQANTQKEVQDIQF